MIDWRKKWSDFLTFLYNKQTKEIIGRTAFSWIQLGTFFLVFYLFIGSFFAVHLAVFIGIIPAPGPDVTPWNFGKYGYPNYPNAKLSLIVAPSTVSANGTYTTYNSYYRDTLDSLVNEAKHSGVTCLNTSNNYGFTNNRICVLLYLTKVFQWTPNALDPFVLNPIRGNYINVSCDFTTDLNISLYFQPAQGIPLNVPNSVNGQSYPYNNQVNYSIPMVGVVMDFSNANITRDFDMDVTCGFNLISLGISHYSESKLDRIYELPNNATFTVNIRNSEL